jgi:hypothetical protein
LLPEPCGRHKCSHAIKELKFGQAGDDDRPTHYAIGLDDPIDTSPPRRVDLPCGGPDKVRPHWCLGNSGVSIRDLIFPELPV